MHKVHLVAPVNLGHIVRVPLEPCLERIESKEASPVGQLIPKQRWIRRLLPVRHVRRQDLPWQRAVGGGEPRNGGVEAEAEVLDRARVRHNRLVPLNPADSRNRVGQRLVRRPLL